MSSGHSPTGQHHSSDSAAHREHKAHAPEHIGCAVITCSDTRTPETDRSGTLIQELLTDQGHRIVDYRIVRDDPAEIRKILDATAGHREVQAVIVNGGTGIARRDSTFEAIDRLLEKRLDGFGEIFRYLSYQDIGSSAIMSRATAGLFKDCIIFSTPGSEGAVRLAMERLILPELGHIVREITKGAG